MHPANRVEAFERLFASSLERAAQVITDAETVRQELIRTFALPADRVSVAPLGVDQRFRPRQPSEVMASLACWGLQPGGYGLSVAAFEPRKKIAELIEAWARLHPATRTRFPLVLAGAVGWRNDRLHLQIERAQAEGWLKHLGFVEEALLPQLYAGARLFVYPSIYEGFGLPPIEAMASGTPVIVSNRSCLPEVCGDAARFIDPDDADGFTAALEESLNDERWQAQMVLKGLHHASRYTWESCISDTVAVYRKALAVLD
jgi:alpha-1,3-rhamnosyl/mannosyltransferase